MLLAVGLDACCLKAGTVELRVVGKEIRFIEGLATWKTWEAFMLLPLTSILLYPSRKKLLGIGRKKGLLILVWLDKLLIPVLKTGSQISSKATYST